MSKTTMIKSAQSFKGLQELTRDRYWYKRYNFQGIVEIEGGGHAFRLWQYNPNKLLYFRIPKWLYLAIQTHTKDEQKKLREAIFRATIQSID